MGNKQTGGKPAKAGKVATPAAAAAPTTGAAPAAAAPAAAPAADPNAKHEKYNLTMAQYEQHYQGWIQLAENGRITKAKFVESMQGVPGGNKEMAEILFDTYDADGSGDVDVDEFLGLIALTLNGTDEEQIRASFHAFDRDRSGSLTKDELRLKVRTLLRVKSDGTQRTDEEIEARNADIDKVLDEVFDLMDTDKNGSIDIDEYTKGFAQNPEVIKFITQLRDD